MKIQYFLLLSVLLHLIPFFNSSFWIKASAVEIIEAEFISAVSSPKAAATLSPQPAARKNRPNSELIHAQGISSEPSGGPIPGASSTTIPPRILKEVFAPYPKEARRAHIEGDVILKVIVNESGTVEEALVIESLGYGLDEAALVAIRQFAFSPGFKDGKIVKAQIKYRYKFRLD